jgi:2,4-dienoyl-CoA reductase-like NADH-dependent reductase (Old Yellow Enzyme family)
MENMLNPLFTQTCTGRYTLLNNRPGRPHDQIGADVTSRLADLEAYGQVALADPDFVVRLKANAAMNEADHNTFFRGTAQGYIDYPSGAPGPISVHDRRLD